jgi:phospholipid/cholesterol/gamma-HCH transport system ATP-binding protein
MAEPIISIRGLKNQFGTKVIHENLDLDVLRGEVLGVVGASGSGKSVLLRTIVGLQTPAAGSIAVLGTDVLSAKGEDLRKIESSWGVMFQDGALVFVADRAREYRRPDARADGH